MATSDSEESNHVHHVLHTAVPSSSSSGPSRQWARRCTGRLGAALLGFGAVLLVAGGIGELEDLYSHPHGIEHETTFHGGPGGGPGVPTMLLDGAADVCSYGACGFFRPTASCQCDDKCGSRGNCCRDFSQVCGKYQPRDTALASPSRAPTFMFYVYRSQSDEDYPPLNANAASLGGVLWYLQNEVVNRCDSGRGTGEFGFRRFKISRILRYKITTKAPEPLIRLGMSFGTRVAFDSGKNTGSWYPRLDMKEVYERYGYHIGCNALGDGPYPRCPGDMGEGFCPIRYGNAVWYSLPGPCPTRDIQHKNAGCSAKEPGGYCAGNPTGQGNCTWTYEEAGEINLDELVGIKAKFHSHYEFCQRGCLEYVKYGWGRDKGKCVDWWDNRFDVEANNRRMEQVDNLFKQRYPDLPSEKELPAPTCDFNMNRFYNQL